MNFYPHVYCHAPVLGKGTHALLSNPSRSLSFSLPRQYLLSAQHRPSSTSHPAIHVCPSRYHLSAGPSPKWSAGVASAILYTSVIVAASTPRAPVVAHPWAYTWRSTRSVRMPQSRIQVWKWEGRVRLVFQHSYDKVGAQETWRWSAPRVNM
ncbi:hypothetical protein BC826DRAFT_95145 [Russula brevipes]|nr:hypothetical protein BC826DRAFT_95145 [Russula brevipes]